MSRLNCLVDCLCLLYFVLCVGVIVMICNMVLCERLLNVGYYLFRLLVGYLGFVLIVLTILLLLLVTRCLCVNILFGWYYLFLFVDFVFCFVCDIVWFVIIGCLFVFVICVSLRMFAVIVLVAFYWFGLFVYYAV